MKKKTLTKRIVSFITALSLSISSTIMVLPASAYTTDTAPAEATLNGPCEVQNCEGTYSVYYDCKDGRHSLECSVCKNESGLYHYEGKNDQCTVCDEMPVITIQDAIGGTITVRTNNGIVKDGGRVASNEKLTISAEYNSGYTFTSIKYKNSSEDGWTTSTNSNVDVDVTESLTISAEFTAIDYNVNVTAPAEEDGTIVVDKENANVGETVTITVDPASGRNFIGLPKVSYTDIKSENQALVTKVKHGEYTFTMPAADVTISGQFEELTYCATGGPGVIVDCNNDLNVLNNDNVIYLSFVNIVFEEGTLLNNYSIGEYTINADENGVYKFKPVDLGIKQFDTSQYRIYVTVNTTQGYQLNLTNPTPEGSTTPALTIKATVDGKEVESGTYLKPGTEVTLSYEPNQDYNFINWSVTGATVTNNTFTMPSSAVTVTATYTEKTYAVTVGEAQNGTFTVEYGTGDNKTAVVDGNQLAAGKFVTIKTTPAENSGKTYVVDEVKVTKNGVEGDNEVSVLSTEENVYTFTMPRNAVTISVSFKQLYNVNVAETENATVTATYGDNDSVIGSGNSQLAEGTVVKVKVDNIADGYAVGSVKYDSTDVTSSLSNGYYSFTMPASDVEITVTIVKTYSVNTTIHNGEYGTVKPCTGYSFTNVKEGDEVRFTVDPDENYGCHRVDIPDVELWYDSLSHCYCFDMPAESVILSVSFERLFALTKEDTEKGSFTLTDTYGDPVGDAFEGDTIRINPDPDDNCVVKSVKYSYGGSEYTVTKNDDGNYEFTMPAENVKVSVVFERAYKVGTNVDFGQGTIKACDGIDFNEVFYGDEVRFTVEPDEGYVISGNPYIEAITSITSGSAAISPHYDSDGKIDYYYFRMPEGDVRICAGFKKAYSVTVDVVANGTVSLEDNNESAIASGVKLFEGDEVVVKVQPADGYKLGSLEYSYKTDVQGATVTEEITPVRGVYSFEMPAADVTVFAEFVKIKPVFTVAVGTYAGADDTTATDKWADVLSFINEKGNASENVTITLNEDYTFTSKDKLPAANKVGCLYFEGDGTLTFDKSVTALKLVSNTSFDLKTASEKKINVTVAADKCFELGTSFSGDIFGKVTGTKTSEFDVFSSAAVDQLSTFGRVGIYKDLTVNGSISAIEELLYFYNDGKTSNLTVSGAKSAVDINKVSFGSDDAAANINLVQSTDGKIPKLTIGETEKLTINVVDSNGDVVDLESGTIVAYSKGNDISKNITIGNKMGDNDLTAFYYPKTKAVKAEYYALSVTEKDGETVSYPDIEAAFEAMTGYKDYTLTLNNDVTVPSKLTLPKGIKSLTIDNAVIEQKTVNDPETDEPISIDVYGDYTITFTAAKLAIPYDVTFDVNFAVSNNKNLIDITVAKDSALTFNKAVGGDYDFDTFGLIPCINKITGTKTSTLVANSEDESESAMFNSIATFGKLEGYFYVAGTVTGVTKLDGGIMLRGEKASAAVENVALGSTIMLCKNSKGEVPKFTVTDIIDDSTAGAKTVNVGVLDYSLNEVRHNRIYKLTTGTTVLYTKGKDLSDKIKIENKTEVGKVLSAVYYEKTKSVKAECESAVAVYKNSTTLVGNFKSLDEAITAINSQTGTNAYTIVLSTAVTADAKFAFPKSTKTNTVSGITIMSEKDYEELYKVDVDDDDGDDDDNNDNNEEVMSAPDSGNELLMKDEGVAITFTGTKLAVPYDVEFYVPVKASNKNDLIDITVAKDADLCLYAGSGDLDLASYSTKFYINKLSGTKNSTLTIGDTTAAKNVSNFGLVVTSGSGNLSVEGPVTGIGSFSGRLSIYGDKASATIENIGIAQIYLLKNSKGAVPKLTVTDIETSLAIGVCDSVFSGLDSHEELEGGTVVAYTKGKDLSEKICIRNVDSSNTQLTPVFDKGKKTIAAVNSQALTLNVMKYDSDNSEYVVDSTVDPVYASSFDELVKLINSNKYAKGDKLPYYQITVNTSLELPANFALPKATQASGMKITCGNDSEILTFTGTKLAVPYDLTLDIGIKADNKTGKLDINVAKDCDLIIDSVYEDENCNNCFGKVTGSGDSTLSNIGAGDYGTDFTGISGFNKVTGNIWVEGAVSKIGEFSGELYIYGEKASADINKINALSNDEASTVRLYLNSKGELPKLTIGSIADDVKLNYILYDYNGYSMNVGSGKTILYTKTADFADTDQIVICDYCGNPESSLSVSFDSKTKSVKAAAENPVSLFVLDDANKELVPVENDNHGSFATFEEAVAYIDKNGSSTTGYYISLTSDIECSKFNLPKAGKASELVIGGGNVINVGKTASFTSNTDLTLVNVEFVTNAKSLTLNAKGNVDLSGDNYGIDVIKGSAKNTLTVDHGYAECDVTGFGTVNVAEDSMLYIITTLKTNNLVLGRYGEVCFDGRLKSATFSSLKAAKGAAFTYKGILKNVPKFTGKAENFKVHKDGFNIYTSPDYESYAISCSGSKILSTKALTDLSIFRCYGYRNDTYSFKQVGNDICLSKAEPFGLSSDKNSKTQYFSQWEDAVNAINAANDSSATYTIELSDSVEISKFTFPAKGKYKELAVMSSSKNDSRYIYISGAVTLTGNTTFKNVTIRELSSKTVGQIESYNVNASGYDIVLDNANLEMANIKAKNVTLTNASYNRFFVNKLDVTDTLTATRYGSSSTDVNLYSYGGITAKNLVLETGLSLKLLDGKKLNVTDTLSWISLYSLGGNLDISVLDDNGDTVKSFAKNYSLGKIKNGAYLATLNSNTYSDYIISPDSNGNLYVVHSVTHD